MRSNATVVMMVCLINERIGWLEGAKNAIACE